MEGRGQARWRSSEAMGRSSEARGRSSEARGRSLSFEGREEASEEETEEVLEEVKEEVIEEREEMMMEREASVDLLQFTNFLVVTIGVFVFVLLSSGNWIIDTGQWTPLLDTRHQTVIPG